jgi:hypothetical protein
MFTLSPQNWFVLTPHSHRRVFAVAKAKNAEVKMEQREKSERRKSDDRRKSAAPVAVERRGTAPERRKVQRRRQIDPTTCERDYSGEEVEFMQALDAYKRTSGRMFPTCSEILEVIRGLGYVRLPATAVILDDGSACDQPDGAMEGPSA